MSGCDAAIHYADHIAVTETVVEKLLELAQDTFLIRLEAPQIAANALPGQFVMVRFAERDAPLIGRALAVYDIVDDADGRARAIDLVFVRKGSFTTPLSHCSPGTRVQVWGPLGNGFDPRPCETLVMAAGGIGQTPMLMLAREALGLRQFGNARSAGWAKSVRLVYGARTKSLLACVEDFKRVGIDVNLCTDDGTAGSHSRVPDRLFELLGGDGQHATTRVATCGPEIMMQKVAEGCVARGIDCQVSMETPMACGIGICFSCVAKVRTTLGESDWDYRRTCVEGPVFDAGQIVW